MRILILGAGAVGGYFGGRLLQAGRDVTFLVRPGRAAELARDGLVIKSPYGDVTLPNPPIVLAENIKQPFDAVILSSKAYDLNSAVESIAPAVGPDTMIVPLLNGMKHLDILSERFGRERVLGGECKIAATLNEQRAVVHLNQLQSIAFGELDGGSSERVRALSTAMAGAGFEARLSEEILQDMWEKWIFLATLAAATCLMRASIGDILTAPGGEGLILAVFDECKAVAQTEGHPPRAAFVEWVLPMLTAQASPFTASMLRDIENKSPIEADHIIGDLLERRRAHNIDPDSAPLLPIAYIHMQAYEARRARES